MMIAPYCVFWGIKTNHLLCNTIIHTFFHHAIRILKLYKS